MLRITAQTLCKLTAHLQMISMRLCCCLMHLRTVETSAYSLEVKASMPYHEINHLKQQVLNITVCCTADTEIPTDPEGILKLLADRVSVAVAQRLQKSHISFYWSAPGSFQLGTYPS